MTRLLFFDRSSSRKLCFLFISRFMQVFFFFFSHWEISGQNLFLTFLTHTFMPTRYQGIIGTCINLGDDNYRLKFSKPGFSNMWTMNFLLFKLVLEKAEKLEIELPTSAGSWKKQESSRKTSISTLLTMPKPLTVWITINGGKFWKRWEYQTTWLVSWETCMQVRKQQLELDMEQQTGSK